MLHEKITGYYGSCAGDPHHRYRSWEHCYRYFQSLKPAEIGTHRDTAALHLGFYLASWGMYRGSSFLLQHAYTVHLNVVDCLGDSQFTPLWECEFGSDQSDAEFIPLILEAADAIRNAYAEFGQPTETLITKVLLGTFGCLPACDQYFIAGFRRAGLGYSSFSPAFVKKLLEFSCAHLSELRREQAEIEQHSGARYPLMKLVDMYFWQLGYDAGVVKEE